MILIRHIEESPVFNIILRFLHFKFNNAYAYLFSFDILYTTVQLKYKPKHKWFMTERDRPTRLSTSSFYHNSNLPGPQSY